MMLNGPNAAGIFGSTKPPVVATGLKVASNTSIFLLWKSAA